MKTIKRTSQFMDWIKGLDFESAARIGVRIRRIEEGNYGDHKRFDGLVEVRLDFGPGYRLYCVERGREVIILLAGGDKKTQTKDIKLAKKLKEEI